MKKRKHPYTETEKPLFSRFLTHFKYKYFAKKGENLLQEPGSLDELEN